MKSNRHTRLRFDVDDNNAVLTVDDYSTLRNFDCVPCQINTIVLLSVGNHVSFILSASKSNTNKRDQQRAANRVSQSTE